MKNRTTTKHPNSAKMRQSVAKEDDVFVRIPRSARDKLKIHCIQNNLRMSNELTKMIARLTSD